jgi:uncharacterized protein
MKFFKPIYLPVLFCCCLFINTTAFAQKKAKVINCVIKKASVNKTNKTIKMELNVLGTQLQLASIEPLTGFYRTGYCSTGQNDKGIHVVAAVVTDAFLQYSLSKGNDLITPNVNYGFPGLKAGNVWCLCAARWKEALDAGVAPPVLLQATNIKALETISLAILKNHAAN